MAGIETEKLQPVHSLARNLHDFVSRLLPDDVEVVEGPIADEQYIAWPEEAALIERASSKRRVEFTCGRLFAHRAIRKFGPDDGPLLTSEDRAPIWPSGLIGSISHSSCYCAAAVARKSRISAIGIDVEEVGRFRPDHVQRILSPREIDANLREFPYQQQLARAAAIFSAKESLYKCLYPLTHAPLELHDVEIILQDCSGCFEVTLKAPAGRFDAGCRLVGQYAVKGDLVGTTLTISNAELPRIERSDRIGTEIA